MATEFKSQICTTVEQSIRLLNLGLKPETADMHYLWAGYWHLSLEPWEQAIDDFPFDFHSEEEQEDWKLRHRPAWSLHRLIELKQPNTIDNAVVVLSREQTYDKLIGMIAKSIKEGYFNKEYLEE